MKVLSIRATQNNLSEAGKAIPFGMQWASYFIGSTYIASPILAKNTSVEYPLIHQPVSKKVAGKPL